MNENLSIKILPSKIYLMLCIFVALLSVFVVWYYFYNFWLSIGISLALLYWLTGFLKKTVLLTHPQSIIKITINEHHLQVEKTDKSLQEYPQFRVVYQSWFLVIIVFGKQQLVIFTDATETHSLSMINRFLNAQ